MNKITRNLMVKFNVHQASGYLIHLQVICSKEYIQTYGFLSFARIWVKILIKYISKNLSSKSSQKLLGHAKQSATDGIKTASKRAIQKKAEATGNLIGNKTY